jgi:prepilin-type N-terminal cleavage/methylation domain-containing protein
MAASLHRRTAFTLVELLVVIAIFVVLFGMLLSGIQMIRETANRTSCMNNLRQLGLAYNEYRMDHQAFPPLAISDPNRATGWGPYLLPYLDQAPLYGQYSLNGPFYNPANQSVIKTHLKVFQCPSVPSRGFLYDPYSVSIVTPDSVTLSWQASPSDYSPIAGVTADLITSDF